MKCVNCGAQIGLDVEKCPYCRTINAIAVRRKENIEKLEADNKELEKKVLETSREERWYRIHKRVNIVLAGLIVLFFVVAYVMSFVTTVPYSKEELATIQDYYNAEDYENLYYYMSDLNLFGEDGLYEYSQMALLWHNYREVQLDFMYAYDEYVETGKYSSWRLEQCVKTGYDVLTCYISRVYDEVSEENAKRNEQFEEEIYMLFTGILEIPEEELSDLSPDDWDRQKELSEYVLEVLPNED